MSKVVWSAVVVIGVAAGALGAQQSAEVVAAKQQYMETASRVKQGDMTVDWRAFRVAAATAGLDWGRAKRKDIDAAFAGMDDGKLRAGLDAARAALELNMADAEAHWVAARLLDKMGRKDEAEHEWAIERALMDSIVRSGDGKSEKTAYFVVDGNEELFFTRTVMGEEPKKQVLTVDGGRSYETLTAVDWSMTSHELWFESLFAPAGEAGGLGGRAEAVDQGWSWTRTAERGGT